MVLLVLAAVGAAMSIRSHGSVAASIVYYTQDSNLFLGVSALICVVSIVRCLKHPGGRIPDWVQRLKYYAVCCIAVTLFVVLFEKEPPIPFRMTVFALIPTFLYAAALYPLNIAGIVDGPYHFLQVRNMSPGRSVMWFFILLTLAYVLALLIWFLNRRIAVFKITRSKCL